MRYSRRTGYGYAPARTAPRRRYRFRLTLPAVVLAAVLLAGAGIGIAALAGAFSAPAANGSGAGGIVVEGTQSGRFAKGVVVDGADIGGLNWQDAKIKVIAAQQARSATVSVTLSNGNYKVPFTSEHVKVSFNTDEVLQKAMQGGAGTYETTMAVDPAAIEQDVRIYADSLYIQPFDSMVISFDPTKPDGQRFGFSDDRTGQRVDGDKLWEQVRQAFASGQYGTIDVVPEPVPARFRKADLDANSKLIVSYQSRMSDHSRERLTNITLAAEAVSKHVILPGEEFSFNETTGERTKAKGYKIAHVINAGVEDNGLGGGVCQVSGTLFNAAARAGLDIVKRHPHTIPSSYLTKGQDATVDYPRKDLVLRNNSALPVIVVMRVDQQSPWKVTAEIYGNPFPAGETIELESEVTRTIPAPVDGEPRYEDSESVDPGTTKIIQPRKGYEITVYRVYKKNGAETKREKLDSVTYQAAGLIVLYNPLDPKPSGLPTATPAATPVQEATPPPPTLEPTVEATPEPTPVDTNTP